MLVVPSFRPPFAVYLLAWNRTVASWSYRELHRRVPGTASVVRG